MLISIRGFAKLHIYSGQSEPSGESPNIRRRLTEGTTERFGCQDASSRRPLGLREVRTDPHSSDGELKTLGFTLLWSVYVACTDVIRATTVVASVLRVHLLQHAFWTLHLLSLDRTVGMTQNAHNNHQHVAMTSRTSRVCSEQEVSIIQLARSCRSEEHPAHSCRYVVLYLSGHLDFTCCASAKAVFQQNPPATTAELEVRRGA